MKQKIIFFDIDGTLFDASSFLIDFYKTLSEKHNLTVDQILKVRSLYDENKSVFDYFNPHSFLESISQEFDINLDVLETYLWNIDLFEKNVYKDTLVIRDLSDIAIIGIFSKGDSRFQRKKISFIDDLIHEENIYIFPNKIGHINEVFSLYSEYDITLIDDQADLLAKVKELFPKTNTILINRNDTSGGESTIKSLEELKSII